MTEGQPDLTEVLRNAWAAVEAAHLPEEIKPIAFKEAVRILSPVESAPPASPKVPLATDRSANRGDAAANDAGEPDTAPNAPDERAVLDRVAAQTGANRAKLEHLIYLDEGVVRINVAGVRLGKSSAERVRVVAQLVTTVRDFGLEEKETPLDVIRAECDRLRVLDAPNFAAHMKNVPGYVINGSGSNRRLRARPAGVQAFPDLVDGLAGDL